jgi:DNA-binding YbaB/EbfC family protein
MFEGISNLMSLLKNARQMGGKMQELNEELKKRRVTGSAGGGMVEFEMNGRLEALGCRIDPQLFAQGDRELVEDLILAAVNQAITQGKQLHAELAQSLTGNLDIPGLQDAISKLTGTEGKK